MIVRENIHSSLKKCGFFCVYKYVTVMASLSTYSVTEPLGLTLGVNAH